MVRIILIFGRLAYKIGWGIPQLSTSIPRLWPSPAQNFQANLSKITESARSTLDKRVNCVFKFNTGSESFALHWIVLYYRQKPDVAISDSDEHFVQLASGKLSGQRAFMKGLVKIKGNMYGVGHLTPPWRPWLAMHSQSFILLWYQELIT